MNDTTIEEVVLEYATQEGILFTGDLGEDELKMRDLVHRFTV